jgi:CRP-like cAMP-binding protein
MWFYSGTVGADAGQAAKNGWIAKAGIVTKSYTADTECPAFGAAADDCEADVRCVLNEVSGMCEAAALTPLAEQYLESFYWAITVLSTVGFGDITPASKVEKMFSILAELIGCVCFAMLMGSLANLFSQNALDSKVSAQVDELLQYCTRKQIPKQLVRKMVTIMEESYRQEAFSADDMMKRLPYAVRKDVETYSYRNLLTRVPLFREHLDSDDMSTQENKAAMEGLTAIMKLFKTLMIQPGEVVYSEGDPAFDFYIIIEGEIELSTTPATRLTHSDGSFFGERELFFSADTHKRRLAYSGPGRDAAENDNLHYLFGRNRYHTATVVSKSRAKLKFLRWDQLIHFLSMTLSTAQHDAGMKHPGPEIFRRIREAAVGRHLLEAEACRQQNRPAPGAEMSTESVIPEDCAAYDCLVAIRAAKKLQQRYRKYHKSAANKHREAARRDMKRLEQSHRGPRLPAGEDWDGSGTHLDAPIQSEAGVDKALFLELMAGQKEMKEMLGDLQVRVKRIEEQSET